MSECDILYMGIELGAYYYDTSYLYTSTQSFAHFTRVLLGLRQDR